MFQRVRWKIWTVILAAVLILGASYYYGIIGRETIKDPVNYSVILYQHTDNEWSILMDGIKQAEEDLNVDVNYITMGEKDTAGDQAEMIQREMDAGAEGILVAAVDSEGLKKELAGISLTVPVICVETGAGEEFPEISAGDYKMGKALGDRILKDMKKDGGDRRVAVIREYMERESVRLRYQGLKDALSASADPVEIEEYTRSEGDYSLRLFVETMFPECGKYVAALDKLSTEEAAAAWLAKKEDYEALETPFWIYGIGNTGQTVNDLDNENIRALVFQNEFNMGYQGLKCLAENRKKDWIDRNIKIKYKLVTKETLYDYENERLLFPSV